MEIPVDQLVAKEKRLEGELKEIPSLIVAYSGGDESVYLLYGGERMLPVTAVSASYSARDREEAEKCVARINFRHQFIETDELANAAYRANNPDRCYFCKDELF